MIETNNIKEKSVAIILVNYNGAKDTVECINSIERSLYSNFHIIVVDNCSTDNSIEILEEQKKKYLFDLVISPENKGFSSGNNIGIIFAKSKYSPDYFWLLNNDTLVNEDTLRELVNGFLHGNGIGVTTGKIFYSSNRSKIWYAGGSISAVTARTEHWNFNQFCPMSNNEDAEEVTFASGCCMLISKDVIASVGLLDESYFLYEEDADYCLRILKHSFSIFYCPHAVLYHKVSASTGTNSPLTQYYLVRNKYKLINKNYSGANKVMAYIYSTLQLLFRCLKHELNLPNYLKGLEGFWHNEDGKGSLFE